MATTSGWTTTVTPAKPKRSPYVAALAEALTKPSEMQPGDHWSKGLSNAFSKVVGTALQVNEKKADNERREALANALVSGDKQAVTAALADVNPEAATSNFLNDQRQAASWARDDKRFAEQNALTDQRTQAQWAREDARLATQNQNALAQAELTHKYRMDEAAHQANLNSKGKDKWSVEEDSNTGQEYFFNEATGEARKALIDNKDGTVSTAPVPAQVTGTQSTPAADPAATSAQAPVATQPSDATADSVPVGKQARNAAGKTLEPTLTAQAQLAEIRKQPYKEILTNQGRVKTWVSNKVADWGGTNTMVGKAINGVFDSEGTNKDYENLSQRVESMFNQYRKEITGAAAAQKELEDLRKTFINTDMNPEQFEIALDVLEERLTRSYAINSTLAKRGILPGSKRYGEAFDQIWASVNAGASTDSTDQPATPTDAAPALETLPATAQEALKAGKGVRGPDGAIYQLVDGVLQKVQ
jgi:hypothetical protein